MNKLYYYIFVLCGENTIKYNQGSLNEQNIRLYIKKEVNIDFLNLYIWWENTASYHYVVKTMRKFGSRFLQRSR